MWTDKVPVWRAHSLWTERPNRTYSTGRVCAAEGCDTRISIYNGAKLCWLHEPARIRLPHGQRKKRYAA